LPLAGAAYGSGLSFVGDLSASSRSLLLTDVVHHHLAIGVLLLWGKYLAGGTALAGAAPSFGRARPSRLPSSPPWLHLQIAVSLLGAATVLFGLAHHMLWLPSAAFVNFSASASNALFGHHLWIAATLLLGSFAHMGIAALRARGLAFGGASASSPCSSLAGLLSHLSWVTLFLGFHTLGIYVHNDVMYAFGAAEKAQIIQPVVAQALQSYAAPVSHGQSFSLVLTLSGADFLLYHALALGIHTATLIFLKGAFDGAGSLLYPDKRQHGFGFACDGPGRGGTCDISGWDSIYLGTFWVLNTLAWLSFYVHWRSLVSFDAFSSSGGTLSGWFRDYLWLNSGNLVYGFSFSGASELAVLAWAFLLAHLAWAVSFMFLISWRGYWQELIEALLFIHLKTPVLGVMWKAGATPVALSILQARCVGLAHFSLGFIGTFAAFLLST